MFGDVELTGLNDLNRVAAALKAAGTEGKGLRRELYAGLNRATKPIRADLNAAIPPSFPRGGGLAARMAARAKFATSTRARGEMTGVRLVARGKGRRTLQTATEVGTIRHPVFGNRGSWVTQSAGVVTGLPEAAFDKDKPIAKAEVLKAITDVRNKIYRSV